MKIVVLLATLAACGATEMHGVPTIFEGKGKDYPPFLEGVWESRPTKGGDVVDTFSLTQTKDGGLTTWGAPSGKNDFKINAQGQITGVVTAQVSDDAQTIVWSHGYTSTLKSAKPINLQGTWAVFKIEDDGSWLPTDACSVEQRGAGVYSFCKTGFTELALHGTTLISKDGNVHAQVAPCGGLVYLPEKQIVSMKQGFSDKPRGSEQGLSDKPAASEIDSLETALSTAVSRFARKLRGSA